MIKWIPVLAVLACTTSFPAHAVIYKCVDQDGSIVFSQSRCDTNAETVSIRSEFKSTTDAKKPGLRKSETRTLKKINRREKDRAKKRKQQAKKAGNTSARQKRCKKAKKKIRKLKNQRRSGCKNSRCNQIDEEIDEYREQKARYCY